MKKIIFAISIILFFLSSCRVDNKIEGLWYFDIDSSEIKNPDFERWYAPAIFFTKDSCELPAFNEDNLWNYKDCLGTWFTRKDSLFINAPNHILNGIYIISFYKDYDRKLYKMKLSNDSILLKCSKALQSFEKDKKW